MAFSTYKIEFISLKLVQVIFSILPRFITLKIGSVLGYLLYLRGSYKKTVLGNMRYAEYWNEEQIKIILPRLYRNIGKYGSDFLRLSSANPRYRVHDYEVFENAVKKGKGVIIVLAHIGNWEILAKIFGKKIEGLHVIAKPMKNSFVDKWLAKKRANTGVITIYTQQALRKMFDVLNKKGVIAILIDQHAGQHGTMIPFLGKPANTVRTVAGIVQKTGCAVIPTYSIMQADGSYDIFVSEAPMLDTESKNNDKAIESYQCQHNEIISEWIRNNPEHYFGWFHKRFRGIIPYN